MELGLFLPISGRAAGPETLTAAAEQAERLGFDAVWSAERVVQPWDIRTPYPYSEDNVFIVPPDRPFLDSMSCLAFLAGRTRRVKLGISVLVLPYRHPLYWARVAASVDVLAGGRFILGVGCGWMAEEFAALGVDYASRGRITDEQLEVLGRLWTEERISHRGRHYSFEDVSFHPKRPVPVWVGGEGRAARRRAGRFGDAWFSYYTRITAEELRLRHEEVRTFAAEAGRDPDGVRLAACRPVEVSRDPQPPDAARRGATRVPGRGRRSPGAAVHGSALAGAVRADRALRGRGHPRTPRVTRWRLAEPIGSHTMGGSITAGSREPLCGIALGAGLVEEQFRHGSARLVAELLALAAMGAGPPASELFARDEGEALRAQRREPIRCDQTIRPSRASSG